MSWDVIRHQLEAELHERISIDALTGAWFLAQRVEGHRHSADDVLTAYVGLAEAPGTELALDLGTGIGGVGLLVLWGLGERARLVAIEAQDISYRLLRANIEGNGLAARVEAHHGDLRDFRDARRFPLITGSPPYFPLGTGIVPADSQKAHARFELRGDVADYARAAAHHLADDGTFVFCFPTPQRARAEAAVAAAGLALTRARDVIPRETLRPLFTLFACRWSGTKTEDAPLVVRHQDGSLTEEMQAVRRRFGFSPSPNSQ